MFSRVLRSFLCCFGGCEVHENVIVKPLSDSEFANREVQNLQTFPVAHPHHLLFGNSAFSAVLLFLFFSSLLSLPYAKKRYACICIDGV